ncbi:hypothetical protein HNR42_001185 [Deinobacterium chartae]|uniref:YgjP-like metallopeptidase domain-containing protein n=1 Tax=Deinobacterium chartae TaxID=521158 RepID=A0A841I0I0_9DEIO|nr:SprT family zinc-dependent metalloprotease [Deinobacterium chartae]MBB6097768.1 hypothetical protein [Deinobacterium chartae]
MRSGTQRREIRLEGEAVHYVLRRSGRRRSVGLTLGPEGLRVNAPSRLPLQDLEEILRSKAAWILRKRADLEIRLNARPQLEDGSSLTYLGAPLLLRRAERIKRVERDGEVLWLPPVGPEETRAQLRNWYLREARGYLPGRVDALRGNLSPSRVLVSSARKRWGSCNSRGELRFNWRLMLAPRELVDYVVVHELCHLVELNHSPAYWRQVELRLPDWRARHEELRRRGFEFDL